MRCSRIMWAAPRRCTTPTACQSTTAGEGMRSRGGVVWVAGCGNAGGWQGPLPAAAHCPIALATRTPLPATSTLRSALPLAICSERPYGGSPEIHLKRFSPSVLPFDQCFLRSMLS